MVAKKRIVIYPGSFDPITNGHIDIVSRSSSLFDEVIVAIAQNYNKKSFIPIESRLNLAKDALKQFSNVRVEHFDNLLIDFAKQKKAKIIIRGLRAVSDFEYEFRLSGMNRILDNSIETLFMTPSEHTSNISSSLIKEIAILGGDIVKFVPNNVYNYILNNITKKYADKTK